MGLLQKFKKKESTGIFVPDRKGFKELTTDVKSGSVVDIAENLGYHRDQVHTYWGDFDDGFEIQQVIVEVFSKNIAFILTKESVVKIDDKKLAYFLRNFKIEEEFESITTRHILEAGIENKSLSINFLSKVLHIEEAEPDGAYMVELLDLYLFFSNGFLVDFHSSNGLNDSAKEFKRLNPSFVAKYEQTAAAHWGRNVGKIVKEINLQAEALFSIPNGPKNEFIPLHYTEEGTVNFHMLRVCHYGHSIDLPQFLEINHGRHKHIKTLFNGTSRYFLGGITYEFLEDGSLNDIIRK